MLNKLVEQTISWFLAIGTAFTTVFLMTGAVTDPVNETKLAAAGGLGLSVFLIAIILGRKALLESSKTVIFLTGLFIVAMLNSVLASQSPLSQNLYGSYGRNTAFIFYFVMALALIGSTLIRESISFKRLVRALFVAGGLNVIYCGWVLLFGDFLGWTNPYHAILGLFGNPDFISAFLGIFIAAVLAYVVAPGISWLMRSLGVATSAIAFLEIHKSHAIQGKAVTAIGIAVVGFYFVRAHFKSKAVRVGYLAASSVVGLLALAGALQKGPFASFIYKPSVSLRGQYWKAGIQMGLDHPLNGVGMDAYGDWYRRARSLRAATVMPGPSTITNASHNVFIDFFSYGGWPLLISYMAMIGIGLVAIFKTSRRLTSYDPISTALTAAWICYEAQAAISINQAGLAIWGWVLLGALVAYEFSTRKSNDAVQGNAPKSSRKTLQTKESIFSPQLIGGLGVVIGLLIAVPPMSADMKWKAALKSQNLANVEAALKTGYMQPASSMRLAQAVQMFEQSKLPDQAYTYAKQGVEFNPDYFDAWKMLYFISKSTQADKDLALKNMKRLDPRNPNVLK